MTWTVISAFVIVLLALVIGDLVSAATKAFVPSVFVSACIFLVGFWTLFMPSAPQDIITLAGLGGPFTTLSMYLLITHMGTMMSIKELVGQWKTIVIAAMGLVGICIGAMAIGGLLFGWQTAIIATPPLTGGLVASIMMSEAAAGLGLTELSVLAILIYVAQGFAGYPLTAIFLKKEGNRLLGGFRSGSVVAKKVEVDTQTRGKFQIFPKLPEKFDGTYMTLFRLGLVAFLAVEFARITGDVVSKYVVCLIFGVLAAELGIVDRKPLNKSGSFGWLMTALMAFIFAGLAKSTPEMVMNMAVPLFGIIVFGVIGLVIVSMITGKLLGESKEMAAALSLTALYGFPPNYILTEEACKALTSEPKEREYLMDQMLPKMLVGGFTTVTIGSVIVAGIFIKFL